MTPSDSHGASPVTDTGRPLFPHPRIIIVKWDMLAADVMSRIARETFPGAEVTLCRTGADALDTLRRRRATLGLFGLTLPDIDGLDLLELVADEHLVQRRMIVTGRRDQYSRQALRVARAHGVFDTSTEDSASLQAAIRQVAGGGCYFSPTIGSAAPMQTDGAQAAERALSFIEQQVFAIMMEGVSDEQIGHRLDMNPRTIASHRVSILGKLDAGSMEALQEAIRRGEENCL